MTRKGIKFKDSNLLRFDFFKSMTIEHEAPLAALARSLARKPSARFKCPVYGIEVAEARTQVVVIIRARYVMHS